MKLLLDSDFLFGLFVPDDPHHEKARRIWVDLIKRGSEFFVLKLAIQETATVLSHKIDQRTAISFLEKLPELGLKVLGADVEMEEDGWKIFKAQTKKGTSYVDCLNLAVIHKYKFDGILSFDKFYPKSLKNG